MPRGEGKPKHWPRSLRKGDCGLHFDSGKFNSERARGFRVGGRLGRFIVKNRPPPLDLGGIHILPWLS